MHWDVLEYTGAALGRGGTHWDATGSHWDGLRCTCVELGSVVIHWDGTGRHWNGTGKHWCGTGCIGMHWAALGHAGRAQDPRAVGVRVLVWRSGGALEVPASVPKVCPSVPRVRPSVPAPPACPFPTAPEPIPHPHDMWLSPLPPSVCVPPQSLHPRGPRHGDREGTGTGRGTGNRDGDRDGDRDGVGDRDGDRDGEGDGDRNPR